MFGKLIEGWVFFVGEVVYFDYNSIVYVVFELGFWMVEGVLEYDYKNVGIVGFGMLGLLVVNRFVSVGVNVIVYEVRDCIGGCVWMDDWFGFLMDFGVSWIYGIIDNFFMDFVDLIG